MPLSVISLLVHAYIAWRLIPALADFTWWQTGVAVVVPELARTEQRMAESRVRMAEVSAEEARAYARTGEPLDKAGGYALQGLGARFVQGVVGSRSNVIGLPLELVVPLLAELGVAATCRT